MDNFLAPLHDGDRNGVLEMSAWQCPRLPRQRAFIFFVLEIVVLDPVGEVNGRVGGLLDMLLVADWSLGAAHASDRVDLVRPIRHGLLPLNRSIRIILCIQLPLGQGQ